MEERAAELADLAHELEESTANLVTQQARRFRSRGSSQEDGDDQSSGETSDREGGEEVFAIDSQDEAELVKGKLLKLERIRDGLKEAIRRGKQERIDKLARLHDYRFELEQLNAQDDDFAPLAPSHKSSPLRPLVRPPRSIPSIPSARSGLPQSLPTLRNGPARDDALLRCGAACAVGAAA
jgi:hypothetical protein